MTAFAMVLMTALAIEPAPAPAAPPADAPPPAAPKPKAKARAPKSPPAPTLEMPPPPPLPPPPPPVAAPAPQKAVEPAPRLDQPKDLSERIQLSAAIGPAFSLNGTAQGQTTFVFTNSPVWMRFVARGTLDLLKLGPGDLQLLVPVGFQGSGFNTSGVMGSIFGFDLMPSVRYVGEIVPGVGLFGELGLGFGMYQFTVQQQFQGYQSLGMGGIGFRLGAGVQVTVLDKLKLLIQPMETEVTTMTLTTTVPGLGQVTVTGTTSMWSLIVGATYAL